MNFFNSVIEFFGYVFQLITNLIATLISFLDFLASSIILPLQIIPIMPAFVASCIIVVVGVAIVKILIGR